MRHGHGEADHPRAESAAVSIVLLAAGGRRLRSRRRQTNGGDEARAECEARIDRNEPRDLAERPAFGGLDLGGTTDLNAFLLVISDGEGGYDVFASFWMPEENVVERVQGDRVPYDVWIREG